MTGIEGMDKSDRVNNAPAGIDSVDRGHPIISTFPHRLTPEYLYVELVDDEGIPSGYDVSIEDVVLVNNGSTGLDSTTLYGNTEYVQDRLVDDGINDIRTDVNRLPRFLQRPYRELVGELPWEIPAKQVRNLRG